MNGLSLAIAALLAAAQPSALEVRVDAIAARDTLAGVVLVARGGRVVLEKGYGPIDPAGGPRHDPGARWRLASITKQVIATLVMQDVAAGRIALDDPVASKLAAPALGAVTVRQLLTHRSGLRNPNDAPSFYDAGAPDVRYCLTAPASAPGGTFSYNNCDYIVLGALLERLDGRPLPALLRARIGGGLRLAGKGDRLVQGYEGGKAEQPFTLSSFGAAGALTGTARDLLAFDRALMSGRLLPEAARRALWDGDPKGGYQALGQWVFPARLAGCAAPKRIVEREGAINGIQTRNFLLPDDDIVVIVFTNRAEGEYPFGQVWQGKGLAHDLLAAVACP